MRARLIRLRFRRGLREGQRQVEDLGSIAEENLEEHLFKRFDRLASVQRFIITWLGLLVILIGGLVVQNVGLGNYYQTLGTVPGGIYREGILGRFTNANPLFATSDADAAVSHLIFAGLLTEDPNGKLVGDLASDYSADPHGTTYTVHLRPHLTWQDGRPLTSADVLFTYQMIENPDAQSPFLAGWQGIEVTAPDSRTVIFKLPSVLAAFPYNLTNGIVPKHLLEHIPATDLRSADFNTTHPVGAGPFAWQAVEATGNDPTRAQEQVELTAFPDFHGGQPKLQKFVVRVFASEKELMTAFKTNQLTALQMPNDADPQDAIHKGAIAHSMLLRAANMVFFKTSEGVLADAHVRQALVLSSNAPALIRSLGYPTHAVVEPLLTGQLAYDGSLAQSKFDLKAAQKLLDDDGWHLGKNGIRLKDNKPLAFNLTVTRNGENRYVAETLRKQWQAAGVKVSLQFQDAGDFQTSLSHHEYQAILDGISIGVDPDVFVYWDSSQADVRSANRLNFSEWKNQTADAALEAGRTRLDPRLRIIKYKPFLQAWHDDSPALGLYQPRMLYLTNGPVNGLTNQPISAPVDHFMNVQDWEIRQAKVTN